MFKFLLRRFRERVRVAEAEEEGRAKLKVFRVSESGISETLFGWIYAGFTLNSLFLFMVGRRKGREGEGESSHCRLWQRIEKFPYLDLLEKVFGDFR